MKEKRARYDTEVKKEIAQVYLEGRRSAASLASELGVHVNAIYKWADQYRMDPENAFPGSGHRKPEEGSSQNQTAGTRAGGRGRNPKKSGGILRKEQQVRYGFIQDNRIKYAVLKLCLVLRVSRSGYYQWVSSGCPQPRDKDAVTLAIVCKIERGNDNNYGGRRVHRSLNDEHGRLCGHGKTARIMR